jgi:DNA repair exonuclease SbcCD ATPase subunit
MIIKELHLKNFKSYGNNLQTLKLDPSIGELILVNGPNGAGKSTMSDAIDYCLYNQVKGKKKKRIVASSLPNRLNNNLYTKLVFDADNTEYVVERSMNPGKVKLIEGGVPYNRTGKSNINDKIEETINIDLDTFKSFISMSINDFKNFMTLTPDEKRKLLDKLFNLGVLNDLAKILKNLKDNNQKELIKYQEQINIFDQNVESITATVQKIKDAQKLNLASEMEIVKREILDNKEEFLEKKKKSDNIAQKEVRLQQMLTEKTNQLNQVKSKIMLQREKMELYDNDKCPECGSDLCSNEHQEKKEILKSEFDKLNELKSEYEKSLKDIKTKELKFSELKEKFQNSFIELKTYLQQLKNKYAELETKKTDNSNTQEIAELLKNIKQNENKLEKAKDNKDVKIFNQNIYKKLDELFSENGIKKSIIKTIVEPINMYVAENLKLLDLPFEVQLSDSFDASIKLLGNDIDVESLSTGETKKVNISIMLAYLKMIRMKRNINILFLDEIFSSIDIEGINSIIHILKHFARKWKVNVFLVHHSRLDMYLFDRILHIEKNITSYIREEVVKSKEEILGEIEDLENINSIDQISL